MVPNASRKGSQTLEEVRQRFQGWRNKRAKGERIPEGLWQAAASLFPRHTVNQISRALRLDYVGLRDRIRLWGKKETSLERETPDFVELPLSTAGGVAEYMVKVKDGRGSRIHIKVKGKGLGSLLDAIKGLLNVQL
jgi:hypothetical protein